MRPAYPLSTRCFSGRPLTLPKSAEAPITATERGWRRRWTIRARSLGEMDIAATLEGGDVGLGPAQDERVDIVGPLERVEGFHVHQVPYDVELVGDAVAAVHVARVAGDL